MANIAIRKAEAQDEASWRNLFLAYEEFYRSAIPKAVIDKTWSRIIDPNHTISCLLAFQDGKAVGLCNYHFHDSTWTDQSYCYLEDLYVDPKARGSGIAKQLILACEQKAKDGGAVRLYWHTQEYNAAARSLYDTITQRSSFIVYRKALP